MDFQGANQQQTVWMSRSSKAELEYAMAFWVWHEERNFKISHMTFLYLTYLAKQDLYCVCVCVFESMNPKNTIQKVFVLLTKIVWIYYSFEQYTQILDVFYCMCHLMYIKIYVLRSNFLVSQNPYKTICTVLWSEAPPLFPK